MVLQNTFGNNETRKYRQTIRKSYFFASMNFDNTHRGNNTI